MTEQHLTEPAARRRGPSPVFLALVALTGLGAWMAWTGAGDPRLGVFVLVTGGWVVSLCLHEFAHALAAYRAGDHSVADKGYLGLNPLRYTDAMLSIVLPLVFVVLGGIGLPGGAVWIDHGRIPGRLRHSLVSAAGPLVNVVLAAVLLVAVGRLAPAMPERSVFWAGLAFLAILQVSASLLNLLPVPGLDGFGIVEPWLPPAWSERAAGVGPFGILVVFALLWVPQVNQGFFGLVDAVARAAEVEPILAELGQALFRFWQS
jgi:Zn-dependent protease